MKVLIVDDEKHVREAIRYFVPWEQYGVTGIYEATNGQEAMEIVLEQEPAVVFTDMRMPMMDGAELLEWLHRCSPYTKTIVISGYQDFSYVKPAIVYGGIDYLLKPVNRKALVAAADRAFQKWNEEKQERERSFHQNIQLNVLRPLYWDKRLTDLISGTVAYPDLEEAMLGELGLPRGAGRCRVAVIALQSSGGLLLRKFGGDVQLTSFVLANVCNEIVSRNQEGFAFRYWHDGADVVILLWSGLENAEKMLMDINESVRSAYGIPLDIGLSPVLPFPDRLKDAFTGAKTALTERNLLRTGSHIHTAAEAALVPEVPGAGSGELLEKLRLSLMSGDSERIQRSLEEWADFGARSGVLTLSGLRILEDSLKDMLGKWKKEWADSGYAAADSLPAFRSPLDEHGEFSFLRWKEGLKNIILGLSGESRLSRASDSRIVLEIREYLDRNFQQEITLQHIADRFFLSRENVSRKFKQVTGENLSDYLTSLRIEKAKELLQNSDLRMSRIAELVGYEDEKYFSRVFKKATGQTPREFRKQEDEEQ
ncbi:response regulator [Paenibacillus sp. HN-1]|uniref:response regulator n=1 Tax=Paenibacillus TaxID=44249 RepID=UPI001CAA2EB3|nr:MULTISPECIES: response regulator [Paenibacillus]MBY9081173.1 response regulator [Paenibacillus sp. CGMCC 1.18879]MBY9087210.1 response regulator [Paenibacillus sinensis]